MVHLYFRFWLWSYITSWFLLGRKKERGGIGMKIVSEREPKVNLALKKRLNVHLIFAFCVVFYMTQSRVTRSTRQFDLKRIFSVTVLLSVNFTILYTSWSTSDLFSKSWGVALLFRLLSINFQPNILFLDDCKSIKLVQLKCQTMGNWLQNPKYHLFICVIIKNFAKTTNIGIISLRWIAKNLKKERLPTSWILSFYKVFYFLPQLQMQCIFNYRRNMKYGKSRRTQVFITLYTQSKQVNLVCFPPNLFSHIYTPSPMKL